ncbi:MAG: hypothetical protein FJ215_12740 [Ignavibacteria bacterium]|nr:hypothetical protein [Ignavibacteria bacterium]
MSDKKRFLLRVDETLYEAMMKWAADDLRSVNAQIEFILTQAARQSGRMKESLSSDHPENSQRG